MTVPELPDAQGTRDTPKVDRPVVLAAVIGGGICLFAVIVGLVLLGVDHEAQEEIAVTGLTSIGATLAGGFAGWIARGATRQDRDAD